VQRRTLQSDVYCVFASKLFAREVNRANSFLNDIWFGNTQFNL
jgi:hypothetical protein